MHARLKKNVSKLGCMTRSWNNSNRVNRPSSRTLKVQKNIKNKTYKTKQNNTGFNTHLLVTIMSCLINSILTLLAQVAPHR